MSLRTTSRTRRNRLGLTSPGVAGAGVEVGVAVGADMHRTRTRSAGGVKENIHTATSANRHDQRNRRGGGRCWLDPVSLLELQPVKSTVHWYCGTEILTGCGARPSSCCEPSVSRDGPCGECPHSTLCGYLVLAWWHQCLLPQGDSNVPQFASTATANLVARGGRGHGCVRSTNMRPNKDRPPASRGQHYDSGW